MREDFALVRSILDAPEEEKSAPAEGDTEPAQMELFG
jgi:hypothetical protein